jgi:hypothetical protein
MSANFYKDTKFPLNVLEVRGINKKSRIISIHTYVPLKVKGLPFVDKPFGYYIATGLQILSSMGAWITLR